MVARRVGPFRQGRRVLKISAAIAGMNRLSRAQKRFIQIGIDTALILLCFALAMALRLESLDFAAELQSWVVMAPVLSLTLLVFFRLRLYQAVIRHISGQALRVILAGVVFSAAVMLFAASVFGLPVPTSVPFIYAALLFPSLGGIRFVARDLIMQDRLREKTPTLIYGAGETGRRLAVALRQGDEFTPVAFIDDDPAIQGNVVVGLRIEPPDALRKLIAETRARAVLLAMPQIGRARRREIIQTLEPFGIAVRGLPVVEAGAPGALGLPKLQAIAPEDLLGRDAIAPREEMMARTITGKVVLVTGAGGTIGGELCRQILPRRPEKLILLDVSEYALYRINEELLSARRTGPPPEIVPILGSVQNPRRMRSVLESFGVNTIYHAAAYKHVPLVEENVVEGVRNNVFGTRILARVAAEAGVESFTLVSSDKAVRPSNVMGATKRMAELVCQAMAEGGSGTRFSMVRFGNVLGSSGSVIPRFREQIERGGPVTVTHPRMTRYFMTISEAAQLVIQAGAMARGGDVFILDMGEPVRIFDLAKSMIRLHGLEPYVIEAEGDEMPVRGDIGIRITGPRKGEKLFEELLIGNNPTGTEHPRILTASEATLEPALLDAMLERLLSACLEQDLDAIRAIFLEAPLGYRPAQGELQDLTWRNARHQAEGQPRRAALRVVRNG